MQSMTQKVASHNDELFMQQRVLFSENLKELKNLTKQLYSAADFFEISYRKEDQKQLVVETLKDYVIKATVNTVDHLGAMAFKVNGFLDEKVSEVSEIDLRLSCFEQRLRTCQDFSDQRGFIDQSADINFPKHHKRYILPGGASIHAVEKCASIYHSAQESFSDINTERYGKPDDFFMCGCFAEATTRDFSPTVVSEEHSPQSLPRSFQFIRNASKHEKRSRATSPHRFPFARCGSVGKRSTPMNSSSTVQFRYPSEPRTRRSASMSLYTERERTKDTEESLGKNKRFYKALLSMGKSRKDAVLYKYLDEH